MHKNYKSIEVITCKNAEDLIDKLSPLNNLFNAPAKNTVYRGHADSDWYLIPSFLRDEKIINSLRSCNSPDAHSDILDELKLLELFAESCDLCSLAIPNDSVDFRVRAFRSNIALTLKSTDYWPDRKLFDIMALAQHYGLPTRLLDWSKRAYVAAFFAASDYIGRNLDNEMIAVWALNLSLIGEQGSLDLILPPANINKNLGAQTGIFTLLKQNILKISNPFSSVFEGYLALEDYHEDSNKDFLVKLEMPASECKKLLGICDAFGINPVTVMPDYYGAAKNALARFCGNAAFEPKHFHR